MSNIIFSIHTMLQDILGFGMILQDIVFRYDISEKIAMFGQIYEDWFGSKVPTLNQDPFLTTEKRSCFSSDDIFQRSTSTPIFRSNLKESYLLTIMTR